MSEKGEFGHRTLVGTFEPVAVDADPTRTYFGLSLSCTWFYLNFRDADGKLYFAYRTVLGLEGTLHFTCNESRDGALRKVAMPEGREFFRGPVITTVDDDTYRMASKPAESGYATGQPFELVRTGTDLRYREGQELQFSGRRIGPGMQVYVPSGPTPLLYTSLQHRVSGTAFGKSGEGFLWLDQCYLPPGVTWRNSDFFKGVELAWTPFGTEYADGSIEMGHICYGADGFNFSLIATGDGEVLHCTSDVAARDIKYRPDTFPEHMYYEVDGTDWEWSAVDDGELPDQASGHDFYRSSEGYLRRAGETRTPVVYHSYNEFFPPAIKAWESTGRIIGR
ncbi:hypothetical protein [Mycolicibacter sinensis]|uniref:Uncharacterized protein n=1 Tax=Mycolicibacter sinensis (strain JDM601) TaxID=875328 RepID=A0A1A3U0Q1_MYCSD|nr:hypothetical protein [Mycolicibacter sinensis]OBK88460.1 hypothetical protein A5648_01315 [Mycolicibacter sinensis]